MKMKQIPQNTVVHTPTEEEAKELLTILHENGYSWGLGTSLTERPYWSNFAENTCYRITKYIGYCSREWYESKGHPIITLAEFKERYFEEEKPQPKFKVGDWVIHNHKNCEVGQIVAYFPTEKYCYSVRFGKEYHNMAEHQLLPYTEPETTKETKESEETFASDLKPTEDMETKELNRCEKCGANTQQCMDAPCQDYPIEKELNLVELLKGHDRETFWSPLFGDIRFFRINTDDNKPLFFEWKEGSVYTYPDGKMYSGTLPIVFPSRALYEQYPLDPYAAWMKWQEEKQLRILRITLTAPDIERDYVKVDFRTPADRDKCIEEIKTIIEKYSKK